MRVYILLVTLRSLKINSYIFFEAQKTILLNSCYHRGKKHHLSRNFAQLNSGGEASEQVQRIRADSFISEIEQQEIECALMTQARFHSEKSETSSEQGFALV